MITLYQASSAWGLPSGSPFCLKLETCFRIFHIPFQTVYINDFGKAPKGKVPYIEYKGELIGDSGLIISRLHADGLIPEKVSGSDRAYLRLIEEHLTPGMVYARWADDANFDELKKIFFTGLPAILRPILPKVIRRKVLASLHAQGIGRHSPKEIAELASDDIDALAQRLGEGPFFGGENPGVLDASAYGLLANLLAKELPSALQDHVREHQHLIDYCQRMADLFYPEGLLAA